MPSKCTNGCGRETNSGICAACRVDMRLAGKDPDAVPSKKRNVPVFYCLELERKEMPVAECLQMQFERDGKDPEYPFCAECPDGKDIQEQYPRLKEEVMAGNGAVTKEKICVDCKNSYKPTSNVQKRCPECKKAKTTLAKTTRASESKPRKGKGQPRRPASPKLTAADHGGGQASSNGDHKIALDLSAYPKVHKLITAVPEWSPAEMLSALLKNKLDSLEETITI